MKMNGRTALFSLLLGMEGCHSLPAFSRSGDVREVVIGDRLSASAIRANIGDEIRWTNARETPVRITLVDYVLDRLACRRNFSGHFHSGAEADLQPNERAALCFQSPGTIRYIVRGMSALHNGEIADSGEIQIGESVENPIVPNESVVSAPPVDK
jgi:hypothetical protein